MTTHDRKPNDEAYSEVDYFHKHLKHDKLDIIIFGATGVAGKQTVETAVNLLQNLHWGIAGRDREKLDEILEETGLKTHTDLSKTPVLIVRANDYNGLCFMVSKCRVVVNCCGPYIENGEDLIKACILVGTHYVDMCAEPFFMESMELKYHKMATKNKVYIISGCGFQSFPMDIGINYICKNIRGTVNYIESYIEYSTIRENILPIASVSAWKSFILAIATLGELTNIRKELFKRELPKLVPEMERRWFLHRSQLVSGVCMPFSLLSSQVVERSQYHFYEHKNRRPIQFQNYLVFPTYAKAVIFLIWYLIIFLMAQFSLTRNFLLNHPQMFSLGLITYAEITDDCKDNVLYKITFNAFSWMACKTANSDTSDLPHDMNIVAKVSGSSPIYKVSSHTLLCSGLAILYELKKLPGSGGVVTPGAAFAKTGIISELETYEHGLVFSINEAP